MRRLSASVDSILSNGRKRRVVVTGMGIVSPLGNTLEDSWKKVLGSCNENCGVTSLEETLLSHQDLDSDKFEREWKVAKSLPCQVAAPVRGLNEAIIDASIEGASSRNTARFVQMALLAGSQAMKQADLVDWLSQEDEDTDADEGGSKFLRRRDRFGVCIGSGMSAVREITTAWDMVAGSGTIRRLSPHFIPKVLTNSAAGRLSLEYGLRGPNLAPSTACAASAHSIGDGLRAIQSGASDLMLVGGAEASIETLGLAGFCRLRALSTSFNDRPMKASRPFDSQRDGFVMGEGAAVLVLEELEHAKERIANHERNSLSPSPRILAEVTGYGASGDAFHVTAPDEAGRGAERAMIMALDEDRFCDANPVPIGYINAHATSTPKGDQIEAAVVDNLLRSYPIQQDTESICYMSSTKGQSGHLLGAAGALEAAFTVMSLVDQKIPPTLNLNEPEGKAESLFEHVAGSKAFEPTVDIQMAISNSFGFGGTNASLVFRAYNE
eukprot:CAMPEP_0116115786 /NCGR_PEP_ID=MMETSP0329-20121206/691_1 /TAXON_ID=697910 /ORGANISM="Pseudo-nitzschia arenysensis, Strain B593" /LENGTH=495 /DNA_ID=CAMNT_0003609239 /DNA_START=69 /DNA_END=1556 /DNA_ORIENTATION=+